MNELTELTVQEKYHKLTKLLICNSLTITTMESCTSGYIASLITDTEGSSAVIKGAYVTYSNSAKVMAGVDKNIIDTYGVYSKQTAKAMAEACKKAFNANIGIGVTGSFGNVDPNNIDSIPGEVDFSIVYNDLSATYHITLPTNITRHDSKFYVANSIVDLLLQIIKF